MKNRKDKDVKLEADVHHMCKLGSAYSKQTLQKFVNEQLRELFKVKFSKLLELHFDDFLPTIEAGPSKQP